ncbi:bile acid-sodium symporter [Mizugakiibacter sediminis]|uniref:Bile acid-sodium symporter n=1 Tax=Mizugakiibacter sediminis TaxID=1475481 RepID=A0A0K8QKY6_9GAMM|nr:bile acid:sodium symporter family protein [Mizugakiibacter sediminis]GAP65341.1 bile acid-sodium symporter [Mizugakiibacter sediminis]
MRAFRYRPDPFTLALLATVGVASLLPPRGAAAAGFDAATDAAIALLFFLHGARLSRAAILGGVAHWRLHLAILACTFALFPLLGLALKPLAGAVLTPELYAGVLFLCALPSTVQSSIAFTSLAGGNVPAAVCAASASNLLGIFLTPLLAGALLAAHGGLAAPLGAIRDIVLLLLAPFAAGHLLRPWLGGWAERRRRLLRYTDQGTVLLVVYSAFGAAVAAGLWRDTPPAALAGTLVVAALLLVCALASTAWAGQRLGFARADRIALQFCGSKKSLASGVPMAKLLFAGQAGGLGAIVLPMMVFHQLQLIVCAAIAQRYAAHAARAPTPAEAEESADLAD